MRRGCGCSGLRSMIIGSRSRRGVARQLNRRVFGVRLIEHQRMPDLLSELRTGAGDDRLGRLNHAVTLMNLNLDELMGQQLGADVLNQVLTDALLADVDQGLERVREGAQVAALFAGQARTKALDQSGAR